MEGLRELEKWLEDNRAHFTTYSLQEIADVAIASGFSRNDVATWITHQKFQGRAA